MKERQQESKQQEEIAMAIVAVWQEALGHDNFDFHSSFFEVGGHSLLLNKVQFDLEVKLGLSLKTVSFLKYPTVSKLSNAIFSGLQSDVANFSLMKEKDDAALGIAEGVAVVGMACRFPQASTLEEFWQNLITGRESIRQLSDAELRTAGVSVRCLQDPRYIKVTSQVEAVDSFDYSFFKLSEREAILLDPQQRLLLECAWEALEDAGLAGHNDLRIGVFTSVGMSEHLKKHFTDHHSVPEGPAAFQLRLAYEKDYAATRIAYKFNLTGPAINVQTACSSSLVALHIAKQSILLGECEAAIVGAASLQWPPSQGYWFEPGWVTSPDGHCRAFDAAAQGTVFGSGVAAIVVMKSSLVGAYRYPYALIAGSAINNDGCDKVSYTAPSVSGQVQVVRAAKAEAKIQGREVTLIEAHGSGTPLGDALEFAALNTVYGMRDRPRRDCALGSVKSNIGHLDCAAGLAGLIKAVLCLHHRSIVPHLHFTKANPEIDLAHSPFYIPQNFIPWDSQGPRYAAVSSLGIGGTNAHVILQESLSTELPQESSVTVSLPQQETFHCLWVSARSPEALTALCQRYVRFFSQSAVDLAAVCFTSQVGRAHYKFRRAVVAQRAEEMCQLLLAAADGCRIFSGVVVEAKEQSSVDESGVNPVSLNKKMLVGSEQHHYSAQQLAQAYVQGDLSNALSFILADVRRRPCVAIPTYPFQRRPVCLRSSFDSYFLYSHFSAQTLLGQRLSLPFSSEIRFENVFANDFPYYNQHHRLFGKTVVPGSSHIVMFLTALQSCFPGSHFSLQEIYFKEPLVLEEMEYRKLQLILQHQQEVGDGLQAMGELRLVSEIEPDHYTVHASACYEVRENVIGEKEDFDLSVLLQQWLQQVTDSTCLVAMGFEHCLSSSSFYREIWPPGEETGSSFRWLNTLWVSSDCFSFAKILRPNDLDFATAGGVVFHPGLLEAGFQLLTACRSFADGEKAQLYSLREDPLTAAIDVPYHIDEIIYDASCRRVSWQQAWAAVRMQQSSLLLQDSVLADVVIAAADGCPCIEVRGFKVRKLFRHSLTRSSCKKQSSGKKRDATVSSPVQGLDENLSHEKAALIEQAVKKIVCGILGEQEQDGGIDFQKNFFDLGMDSLSAIEYRGQLQRVFRRTFPATIAFDYPTLAQISGHLRKIFLSETVVEKNFLGQGKVEAELANEILKLQQVLGEKSDDETV